MSTVRDPGRDRFGKFPSRITRMNPGLLIAGRLAVAANLLANLPPPKKDEIPPLRPPRGELPPGFWEQHGLWVIVLSVLALAALGAILWWFLRPKPPIIIPPATQARQTLAPLAGQPEDGALLSRVSQVLQHYVLAAFRLPAEELTTAEFCQVIRSHEQIGSELSQATGEFLKQCDEQKFAPRPPRPALGAVGQALKLIDLAEARRAALEQAAASAQPPRTRAVASTTSR